MLNNPENIAAIETAIDADSLQDVLQMVSTICWEKASHIQTNWQDTSLAKSWEKAALAIERVSVSNAVLAVS